MTQILLFYSVYSCIITKFTYDTLYTNIPIFFHIYIIAVTLLLLGHSISFFHIYIFSVTLLLLVHSIYSCVITTFLICHSLHIYSSLIPLCVLVSNTDTRLQQHSVSQFSVHMLHYVLLKLHVKFSTDTRL